LGTDDGALPGAGHPAPAQVGCAPMALRRPASARVPPRHDAIAPAREAMKGMPHNAVNVRATMAHHPEIARGFGGFARAGSYEFATARRRTAAGMLCMRW